MIRISKRDEYGKSVPRVLPLSESPVWELQHPRDIRATDCVAEFSWMLGRDKSLGNSLKSFT